MVRGGERFPEAEHGGFYAALVRGYYREAGLDVRILPGGPETPVLMTSNGRGAISDRDYHALSGQVAARELTPKADVVLFCPR